MDRLETALTPIVRDVIVSAGVDMARTLASTFRLLIDTTKDHKIRSTWEMAAQIAEDSAVKLEGES